MIIIHDFKTLKQIMIRSLFCFFYMLYILNTVYFTCRIFHILFILHIVYFTCRIFQLLLILHIVNFTHCIFHILYILHITFLHITFSFPCDDDGDHDK